MQIKEMGKRVIDKLMSARFLITILMVATFCFVTLKALNMFIIYLENEKVIGLVREITMFLLGSFCTQVGGVISSYFNRNDRIQNDGGKNNENMG